MSDPCPKAARFERWEHGHAQDEHKCPYQSEINDDDETLCRCCERCEQECRDDI